MIEKYACFKVDKMTKIGINIVILYISLIISVNTKKKSTHGRPLPGRKEENLINLILVRSVL